ncbi:hypothetical protein ACJRO7_005360 [Eucalyptus globulus]|uniref:CSD domain-containing protein n=1 Tax=Eucalyptus globulus TaxID=34317 RepID=A0ABD3J5G1_EUCGL
MASQERCTDTVLWFNDLKGFGFIKPSDGGEDLFVHQSSIRSDGFCSLAEGEEVECSIVTESEGKSSAIDVTGPDKASVKGGNVAQEGFSGSGGGSASIVVVSGMVLIADLEEISSNVGASDQSIGLLNSSSTEKDKSA